MALKKCTTSFATKGSDGKKRFVRAGDLLEDGDDVVKSNPKFFEDVSATNKPRQSEQKKSPVVEQATAAPGEVRRGPGRPPKVKKEDDR